MNLKEYIVYASEKPSESNLAPQIYHCNLFATNEITARSKTFNLLRKKYKIKSTFGVILKIEEVAQYNDVKVRNFTVHATYKVKTNISNVKKEIRALTRVAAVEKLYQELKARHSATPDCVTIIEVVEIKPEEVVSKNILQVINNPKYPLFDKRIPATAPNFQIAAIDRK
ncbi:large subunit ribosomal protein L18Ae [Nematocida homosporus]|uniref:large subunit ribosomal protein L18Ae n=1 Tax=Nematocida homosporus TaxID=1912981 RepID=UPI00221FD05B|nr:large subunit ribosomal protein L18Ae [Nematocida homosporus]KAI5184575.1 large subunit ribosomal protein L18Ae [Nematocida homosporus]